jgi:hypothetical protein
MSVRAVSLEKARPRQKRAGVSSVIMGMGNDLILTNYNRAYALKILLREFVTQARGIGANIPHITQFAVVHLV